MNVQNQYNSKRLLMLGNNNSSCEIIEIAKRLGAYTVATDNIPDSPVKKIADKSYSISTADIDNLVNLAKSEKIDCVMAGASDFNIEKALTVSEILGLSFYVNREQWEITSNKDSFKEICRKFNISVIDEFHLDGEFNKNDLQKIDYPVIIKPVDSSASRGISVCKNENELRGAYEKALSYSSRKKLVLEKYIEGDEVAVYFTIQDGYASLSAMCDRYTLRQGNGLSPLQLLYFFPSKHLAEFQKNDVQKFRDMFRHLKINNGFLFVQAFFKDGRIIPYELNCRIPGGETHKNIFAVNGVSYLEMLVRFSLSGEMSGWNLKSDDDPNCRKWTCKLSPILKPGRIKKITGLDAIRKLPEVFDIVQFHSAGDIIGDDINKLGTLKQLFANIFLVAEKKELLINSIKRIQRELLVSDEKNQNMLFDFDVDKFDV